MFSSEDEQTLTKYSDHDDDVVSLGALVGLVFLFVK